MAPEELVALCTTVKERTLLDWIPSKNGTDKPAPMVDMFNIRYPNEADTKTCVAVKCHTIPPVLLRVDEKSNDKIVIMENKNEFMDGKMISGEKVLSMRKWDPKSISKFRRQCGDPRPKHLALLKSLRNSIGKKRIHNSKYIFSTLILNK